MSCLGLVFLDFYGPYNEPLGGHQSTAKLVKPSVSKMMNNVYDSVRVGLNLESMCLIA